MTDQSKLKSRLLSLRAALSSYACHGMGQRYRVAAGYYDGWNGKPEDEVRYVEKPSSHGLRVVGFADDIVRWDSRGYYTDEFCDAVMRDVVLQLPTRHGKEQFLAAYADPHNDGPVCVDMRGGIMDSKEDAAHAADSFAERQAEKERDYQEAYQLGSRWQGLGEEIASERAEVKALLAEIRTAKTGPTICRVLRGRVKALRHSIAKASEERAKLADRGEYNGYWLGQYADAFNEGAGSKVL